MNSIIKTQFINSIIGLVFLCVYMPCTAQKQGQAKIDSLINEIPGAINDTVAVRLHKLIAEEYTAVNPTKARAYADRGMQLARAMKWDKAIAVFYATIANLYSDAGKYDSALLNNEKALAIHKKNKDSVNIASTHNNLGVVSNRQSKYTEATQYFFESLKVAEQINNSGLKASAYNNISGIYSSHQDFARALDYGFKTLKLHEDEGNIDGIADAYVLIADIYLQTTDSVKAYSYYQQALPLYQQTDNLTGVARIYTNMATLSNKNYKAKLDYATQAQAIWDVLNPTHPDALINTGNLGVTYLDIAKEKNALLPRQQALNNAVAYLKKAIALYRQSKDVNGEAFYTGNLAEAQEQLGDYKNAYINFRFYQRIQDSIFSQENKNKIAQVEAQREVTIRDKEIAFNKITLANQAKLRWALVAGLCMLLVIAGLLFYQSKNRQKVNRTLLQLNTELDEANKLKARFFAMISHDLRTPVSKLIGFLQLQKNEPNLFDENQLAAHQEKITRSAETLLENMETMLLWSKGQMQHFKPVLKPLLVADLFEYIQKNFGADNQVRFHFNNSSSAVVTTDENYLQVIMYNLTANAVKALQNIPQPSIEWSATNSNGKTLLSISDNGPGIAGDQIQLLYNDTALINGNKGLGMHIIRDLAKAIQANISVHSSNKGTQISITL